MPYSSMPEPSAPSTKYFIAASAPSFESRSKATSAYRHSANSSSPRYRVRKPFAEIMIMIPSNANSIST